MDMKEEMMNDAIDDVIGDEEDDEERLVFENFPWEHALEPPKMLSSSMFLGNCPPTPP